MALPPGDALLSSYKAGAKPISSLSHLGWRRDPRRAPTRPGPSPIGVGSPQDPSPVTEKFLDQGVRPGVKAPP